MPYPVKCFFEICEDMVQILLMLEVLFTQNSEVEDLFRGASSGSEPSLFFSNYLFSSVLEPVQDDFQHDFTWMTDEAFLKVKQLKISSGTESLMILKLGMQQWILKYYQVCQMMTMVKFAPLCFCMGKT